MTAMVLTGNAIPLYRAAVLKSALTLYAKHKIQVNRAYTPTAMLKVAGDITGKKYPRGYYDIAANDLQEWIDAQLANR
jgi:hypothetical protein